MLSAFSRLREASAGQNPILLTHTSAGLDACVSIHYHSRMLAETAAAAGTPPLVEHPAGLLAILLAVLAVIFWSTQHPIIGRLFKVVPALVFCYFVPTALTTLGVIPDASPLYDWIKDFVLPASLLLLILALDLPAIIRLGPKAVVMLLAGTAGVVIGGPVSLLICQGLLPDDAWRGMSALAGSWIGGGANFVAIGTAAEVSDAMLGLMVVPDVFVASIWMGVLLYLSGHQEAIDRWTGADARAIRHLQRRMTEFQERTSRIPSVGDLLMILAWGFVGSWLSYKAGILLEGRISLYAELHDSQLLRNLSESLSASTWKFIVVTALGVLLSFTAVRNLEGAGASRIGSVMIYLLVACIGASANFAKILEAPAFILMGFVWMACHVVVLLVVGRLIRAPIFLVAVGSQSNIGGAASAPVVASAFHPSLAAVGALMAVAGYVLGTYAGLLCMTLLKAVAGV